MTAGSMAAGTAEFESLATVAFTSLGRDLEKEIAKFELDDFCMGGSVGLSCSPCSKGCMTLCV